MFPQELTTPNLRSVCLIYLCIYLSIYLSIYLLSIYLSVYYLSIYLAIQVDRESGQTGPGGQRDQRNGGPESGNSAERKIQLDNSDYHDNWLAPLWEA